MSHPKNPKFYVTTPIYYINDVPHIGHAYSTIAADVLARYYRQNLGNDNVLFVTGTDENSQKTINAAEAAGESLESYTDNTAKKWQKIFDDLDLGYSRFIRTTDKDHVATVQSILQKVYENGDIYKGVYEGLYCVGHEAFMKEDELVDGLCPDHKKAPDKIREENYFFKLSRYQDQLKQYILDNPEFIQPAKRRNEIMAFIERGLEDFSISRETQTWGIRLPFDDSQVAYVWFDALVNYLTAAGYGGKEFAKWWPADVHIVGKDIIKFHCIYWPAMLWSAGLELPHKVFAHGFFTLNGEKISKSTGNAIDPVSLAEKYGNDALRYYLLREIPFGSDGDFSFERFKVVYETELGDTLGNLVSRVAAMSQKYEGGKYSATKVPEALAKVSKANHGLYGELKFSTILSNVFEQLGTINNNIAHTEPWALVKTEPKKVKEKLDQWIAAILWASGELRPFLPQTTTAIDLIFADSKVGQAEILFPRID